MSIMTSQVLKFDNSAKTQKSIYLENKTFFQNKKIQLIYLRAIT